MPKVYNFPNHCAQPCKTPSSSTNSVKSTVPGTKNIQEKGVCRTTPMELTEEHFVPPAIRLNLWEEKPRKAEIWTHKCWSRQQSQIAPRQFPTAGAAVLL